jgi:glycerophosphoryl diester phosphodiesterase
MKPYLDAARPIAFAHRGGARQWPENTLEAFEAAYGLGYRYMETDMHLTRDGAIVLFHDPTLERTTDGHGPVAHKTLDELRRLDAGYWFTPDGVHYPWRGRGVWIPTLDEALALAPDLRLNVEIKPQGREVAEAMWRFIESRGCQDRVLVASAHAPTVRAFRRIARGPVATSAGTSEVLAFWLAVRSRAPWTLPIPYDALQVPEHHRGARVVDRRFVDAAHRRSLQVHVWTVDEPEAMRRLRALGVDGLMTDYPDRLAPQNEEGPPV